MEEDSWVQRCQDLNVEVDRGKGRPGKTWGKVIREDLRLKLCMESAGHHTGWITVWKNAIK